jgi:hypothetical protein
MVPFSDSSSRNLKVFLFSAMCVKFQRYHILGNFITYLTYVFRNIDNTMWMIVKTQLSLFATVGLQFQQLQTTCFGSF